MTSMMASVVFFAKSNVQEVREFMGSTWGLTAFFGGALLVMILGFSLMKYLDTSKSYQETYFPPR